MVEQPMNSVGHARWSEAERGAPHAHLARTGPPEPELVARLARAIETTVVPRLVLVHRAAPAHPGMPPVRARDVVLLAAHVAAGDEGGARADVEAVRARGATLENVALDLMAPAARRLGEMWCEDSCDYTAVTLGVWRLQALLRDLSPLFQPGTDPERGERRRALVVPVPGDDHSFGNDVVAGFLRLSGWEVSDAPVADDAMLERRVRRGRYLVIGLSVGYTRDLSALARLIARLRRAAGRRAIGVLVGGRTFTEAPESALRVGADAVALDARHAVRQAESLLVVLAGGGVDSTSENGTRGMRDAGFGETLQGGGAHPRQTRRQGDRGAALGRL